mmetsp:Transcript_3385/g.10474  ORF Transcript_3385/g.10474 Transcript_3385/m.10474 type:complete len:261 (-) Transcript_3385:105-887(-)|eukprot:CAMPEP_0197390762 /NCGR_PEP_ID=MMETSP1165-20131217/2621_1 /TAXON_ID=284809 /ORGANISM="Chrysocystis fragilis, Strain CCMP3189" /LENGTH=260 /DNA_ID=CAMNT_0042916269 /DNA_START=856 /DNA_END=1638 /DNA_ORIENTATION=-
MGIVLDAAPLQDCTLQVSHLSPLAVAALLSALQRHVTGIAKEKRKEKKSRQRLVVRNATPQRPCVLACIFSEKFPEKIDPAREPGASPVPQAPNTRRLESLWRLHLAAPRGRWTTNAETSEVGTSPSDRRSSSLVTRSLADAVRQLVIGRGAMGAIKRPVECLESPLESRSTSYVLCSHRTVARGCALSRRMSGNNDADTRISARAQLLPPQPPLLPPQSHSRADPEAPLSLLRPPLPPLFAVFAVVAAALTRDIVARGQ